MVYYNLEADLYQKMSKTAQIKFLDNLFPMEVLKHFSFHSQWKQITENVEQNVQNQTSVANPPTENVSVVSEMQTRNGAEFTAKKFETPSLTVEENELDQAVNSILLNEEENYCEFVEEMMVGLRRKGILSIML